MLDAFAIMAPGEEVPGLLAQRCAGVVNRVSFLVSSPSAELLAAIRLGAIKPGTAPSSGY